MLTKEVMPREECKVQEKLVCDVVDTQVCRDQVKRKCGRNTQETYQQDSTVGIMIINKVRNYINIRFLSMIYHINMVIYVNHTRHHT